MKFPLLLLLRAPALLTATAFSLSPPFLHAQPAPEPVPSAPEPVPSAPEPVPSAPEPVPSAPEPVPSAPESVPSAPESVPSAPESVPSTPEPVPSAPEPVPSAPESVPGTPAPVPPVAQPSAPAPPAPPAAQSIPSTGSIPSTSSIPSSFPVPDEDILDIRGPIHIEAPFPWIKWTAAALGVGLLGFLIGKWSRRPGRGKLAYEIALEKLTASRSLMDGGNAQPFSLAVSEIVRAFIEQSLSVRAAHRTTSEFLHDLVKFQDSPLAAHRAMLSEFLEYCDLAKFARWSLTLPQMEAMLKSAAEFVATTGKSASMPAPLKSGAAPPPLPPAKVKA